MQPQNMPLWYTDYCELKALVFQQVQEGHAGLPSSFCKQDMKLPWERYPPFSRRTGTFFSPEKGTLGREKSVKIDWVKITYLSIVSPYGLVTFPQLPLSST